MPTVPIEAMARGMAAIATDVGAVSELVKPESGLLPPDSAPMGIANAMEALALMRSETLLTTKAAGRGIAQTMTWEREARQVTAIAAQADRAREATRSLGLTRSSS
jgi:glycosyltransferase involved in cell wall biosynthesis